MTNPNFKRKTILKLVENDPGMGFLDLQKETGYGNGVLSHHLKTLEKSNLIRIRRANRKIWVFPPHLDSDDDNIRIHIRKETCKKIIEFLLQENTANFVQIQTAIKKSPGTTSSTLKMLVENRIVTKIHGFPNKYVVADHDKTAELLDAMKISQTDKLKERFADTFSYF